MSRDFRDQIQAKENVMDAIYLDELSEAKSEGDPGRSYFV
jgi:hypothetical protein